MRRQPPPQARATRAPGRKRTAAGATASPRQARPRRTVFMAAIVLVALALSITATVYEAQFSPIDVFEYQCYASGFWQGVLTVDRSGERSCAATWGTAPQQFRSFPTEYPVAALAVFSLPLLTPWWPYKIAYSLWLALLVVVSVALLTWRAPPEAAVAFLLYTFLAAWGFVMQRYDLYIGLTILLAVLCARRDRWRLAATLLAIGTLLKIVPVALLPLLLITVRQGVSNRWRLDLVAVFVGVCALVLVPAALLDPAQALGPLQFLTTRPLQVESLPGLLLWLSDGLTNSGAQATAAAHIALSYNSLNVVGGAQAFWSALALPLTALGLLAVYWRAWRGKDSFARSVVVALLVLLVTGKTASPQYMLWLIPTVAVTEGLRLRWVLLAAVTWLIINHYYTLPLVTLPWTPSFVGAILVHNVLLAALTIVYLLRPGDRETAAWPSSALWRRSARLTARLTPRR